ncbi:MAG TPA: DsbA family protein [Aestuariivirga sp.]|nr:DsbA family protein [Aestuariivirga sp.]
MAGAGAFAGLGLAGASALALDIEELNKAPELGEMALGPADAKVTVIEYASATCPHCAAFHKDTFGKLKTEYIDTNKIRFVFREFPLNDAAMAAFMIARAAPKEAYFPLMDVYFNTLETWAASPAEGLFNIARQAGFSKEKFDATLKDEALANKIIAIRDGGAKFGVQGTPTFFINGELFDGERTIEAFRAKIDPLLQ